MAATASRARALAAVALVAAVAATDDTSDATPTPPAIRYTWTECACKVTWEMDVSGETATCSQACCNLDDDPFGDYCYVEDPECEAFDWGYCRPETMSHPGCTDYPPDWSDTDGDDCYAYEFNEFCTASGGYGASWDESWGKFEDYTTNGHDSSTACCSCGGGSGTFQGYNDNQCADLSGWSDADGDDCLSYSQFYWCTPEGGQGTGWHEEWGTFSDFASDGKSAPEACCACGGGSEGTYEGTQDYKPDDDTAGVEVPSGVAWAVASGPCKKGSDECISSPNYPRPYGDGEKCVIGVNTDMIKPVTGKPFSTEWGYDTLQVNGQTYSGSLGPHSVKPLGPLIWSSDNDPGSASTGWKLCQDGAAPDGSGEQTGGTSQQAGGTGQQTGGTSPAPSPDAEQLGTLDTQTKGMGVIVVLIIVLSVAAACWCKLRKSTPDSGIGEGMPRGLRA